MPWPDLKEFCFPRQATGDVYLPGNQVSTKEAKKRKYEEGVVRDLGRTFATSQPDAEEDKPMPEEWTPIGAPDGTLLFYYNFNTHEKRLPRKREAHAHTRVQLGGVEKDQAKLEADALAAAGASSTSTPVGKSAAAVAPSPIAGPSPPAVEPGVLEAANAHGAAQPGRELSMDELRKKQVANSIVTLGSDGATSLSKCDVLRLDVDGDSKHTVDDLVLLFDIIERSAAGRANNPEPAASARLNMEEPEGGIP